MQQGWVSPDGRWHWDGGRWIPIPPPPPPPPPPTRRLLLPDGTSWWDGWGWHPFVRIPWQLKVARILLFVEAGGTGIVGLFITFTVLTLGAISVIWSSNGIRPWPGVVTVVSLATFAVTTGLVVLLVMIGVKLIRRRWAWWTAIVLQSLFAILALLSIRPSSIAGGLTELAWTGFSLYLLLAPVSRQALAARRAPPPLAP